jgi:hypothetical protein
VNAEFIPCSARFVPHPSDNVLAAAERAVAINPANRPSVMMGLLGDPPSKDHLAVLTSKYWRGGANLTVGFMDSPDVETRREILGYLNLWSNFANVSFVWSTVDAQVRIDRGPGGYWSYLGTDILGIPRNEPTMNLQGITARTPDREKKRVIPHEAGHTLGCPHEHMRRDIVARIDPQRAVAYFRQTQGWNASMVQQQVLTPLSEQSLMSTTEADETSVMAYSLPGSIMRDGKPVIGGSEITPLDGAFIAKVYPKPVEPPVPPPPVSGDWIMEATGPDGAKYAGVLRKVS